MFSFSRRYFPLLTVLCVAAVLFSLAPAGGNAEKEIPITKFSQNVGGYGVTMTFLYCYSCGYRKAFDEYYNVIHEKYPEITIRGGNYDPPGASLYLSKVLLVTKLLMIIALMSNFDVFGFLRQPTPSWWRWCTGNKLYACMMIFFLGNMIEAKLMSSGAFEISLNDVPVWSKLETGRIPAPQELFQIIDSHLQFSEKIEQNPDFVK
ncbi:thioredoxin reductase-like selenoprotein T homolog CG3887 [Topomyia yanbarensis]|uniref:thioredoxin reductase-like selenoprotein T homolog CG3887 n=1 Tax=Topomyia yanbarensis TaxID=2498891 RepID=UPI00273BD627|nr:thioredoxin reductase-like selenoprotein T homolog CG3887 [Topomyia yanbarensis]